MTSRITKKQMEFALELLNNVMGYASEPYAKERDSSGRLVSQQCFVLDGAYGGWRVCLQCPEGGQRDITPRGSKRETYDHIQSLIKGAELMALKMNKELSNPKSHWERKELAGK